MRAKSYKLKYIPSKEQLIELGARPGGTWINKDSDCYLKVCEAASNINVTLKDHYEDGVRARIIPVANFDCVEYIEVHCKHYLIHMANR